MSETTGLEVRQIMSKHLTTKIISKKFSKVLVVRKDYVSL